MGVLAEIRGALSGQKLSFKERWEKASKLSEEEQVAFLAEEILGLISQAQAEKSIVTIFGRGRVVALPFTLQQVEKSSSLPGEIKDFLFPALSLVKGESVIWLFESPPRSLAIPVVSVGLGMGIQRKLTFGIEVFGQETLFRRNFKVGRYRVALPGSLKDFGQRVGELQVAEGLVGFAQELIYQKQQLEAPK